ncbi:MAG TPA: FGGY-family carbohydrate kinase [Vicinamibacteria bacterium]
MQPSTPPGTGRPRDSPCILAVDLGTSGCKTALVSLEGHVAGWAFAQVPLHILPGGGAEQDPADWWTALVSTARKAMAQGGVPPEAVAGVCCSCQGEGTVPVDRGGRALMNALTWADMRGAALIRAQARGWVNVAGYGARRLARWLRITGGAPALTGSDPAAHMLLVRDRFPEVYRATHKFLNVLDYVNLRLTGRFVATHDSILTSWVTDNRDLRRVRYHPALVAASGIDADKYPDVVPCTEVIGTLQAAAAVDLGLPAETPVVAGSVDNTAVAIGSGALDDFEAHLYVGTSSWIGAHVPFKKADVFSNVASVPCARKDRYLMVALQSNAGVCLSFLKDRILYHDDELLKEGQAPDVYGILDRMAARVPAGSRGLIFTPWLHGERTPVADPCLRGGFFNLGLEHSRPDMVRAILEGVAFNTRWMRRPVERFLGRPLPGITVVGGGAVSDTWCQVLADVLDMPVRQLAEPMQANARGAAGIGAVGLGLLTFPQTARMATVRRVYSPEPAHRDVYDRGFSTFLEVHRRVRPLYRRLNAVQGR